LKPTYAERAIVPAPGPWLGNGYQAANAWGCTGSWFSGDWLAPHHDPVVIDRSQSGDHCQMTLERWLRIGDEPGVEEAVTAIHAILAASARTAPARTAGAAAAP